MLTGHHATLAQSVERLTRNEQVDSSILSSGSVALDVQASRVLRIAGIFAAGSPESLQGAGFARVAELVDAQDLGSCVFDVWVQVPSRAHNSMLCPFFLGYGLKGVRVVGFCFFLSNARMAIFQRFMAYVPVCADACVAHNREITPVSRLWGRPRRRSEYRETGDMKSRYGS